MKRMVASLVLLGLAGTLAVAGCGDDTNNNTTTGGAQDIPLDNIGTEMSELFCGVAFACCESGELTKLFEDFTPPPTTQAECEGTLRQVYDQLVLEGLKKGVEAGRLQYDGAKAGDCFAKLEGQCGVLQQAPFEDVAECQTVFVGKVADGADCGGDNECSAAGSSCIGETDTALGKCQPDPKEGEPCPEFNCVEGLRCSFSGMGSVCVKPKADGEACTGGIDCTSDYCDSATSTCAPQKAVGAACGGFNECKDSYCDFNTNVCTAKKADGAACMSFEECVSDDCDTMSQMCAPAEVAPACDGK
jgi:hypothetical protein